MLYGTGHMYPVEKYAFYVKRPMWLRLFVFSQLFRATHIRFSFCPPADDTKNESLFYFVCETFILFIFLHCNVVGRYRRQSTSVINIIYKLSEQFLDRTGIGRPASKLMDIWMASMLLLQQPNCVCSVCVHHCSVEL